MTATIFIPPPLRLYADGAAELDVSAPNVGAALRQLEQSHPSLHRNICDETGSVRRHLNLFLNKSHLRELQGLETPLSPGDVLFVLPAVSGG